SDRPGPQGHGCHRLRACPGEPYAYHRVLDPGAGGHRGGVARQGAGDPGRRLSESAAESRPFIYAEDCGRRIRSPVLGGAMNVTTFDINELKRRMQGALAVLKQELAGLRTGRASAHLLDPVHVEAYGQSMALNQLATVSIPQPRMLSVQVWDKSMLHAVEKAILAANLG